MQEKNENHSIEFSLTLGSSHISLVAAHKEEKHINTEKPSLWDNNKLTPRYQILGASRISHNGVLKKGVVSSIESLSHSILEVVDEVERQTGLNIENVITCLPCVDAIFDNHKENYTVKNTEIRRTDIEKIHQSVFNMKPPQGFETIHAIPASYCVDGKNEIKNPIGMKGNLITLDFHRIFIPNTDLHNIGRSCYQAGLHVDKFIYEPLAAAEGALTEDEKEFGCVSISMGTYLTHVVVYLNHFPVYSKEFQLGSHHITKDLAIGLKTTQIEAERIKKEMGRTFINSPKDLFDKINLLGIDGLDIHTVTRQDVFQIIEPRIHEILETIFLELKKTKLIAKTSKGIILTGGGALLSGISITAEKIFGLQSRIGYPLEISGSTEGLKSPLWVSQIGAFSDLFNPMSEKQFDYQFGNDFNFSHLATKFWQKVKSPFA